MYNSASAEDLSINDKGDVQRGLFDTQTKFSDYLSYFILSSEEARREKKPPFYDVIIEGPLSEYFSRGSQKSNNVVNALINDHKLSKLEKERGSEIYNIDSATPLRNIKDSDLRLDTSLPKMMNILTSLNIDMASELDKNDYENLINIIAFPIYATNPSKKMIDVKKREYIKFVDKLKNFLTGKGE